MPEFVRHIIDIVEMRPFTTLAIAIGAVFYLHFMTRGPHTR